MRAVESEGPRLLTIRGAAEFLGVSAWTVRSLVWDGEVPFVRAGRRHMVAREDLLRWIERAKETNGTGTIAGTFNKMAVRHAESRS